MIAIKNMKKMPEDCTYCPCFDGEYDKCKAPGCWEKGSCYWEGRPDWCPLIEIPPHGALIDMDDFLSEWPELESYRTAMLLCEIIPAEGGDAQ